jgi:hypothetical protein
LAYAAAVDWAAAYDSVLVRAYLEEFERVYAQAEAPARCR